MKSLVVYYQDSTLKTRLEDIPVPQPGPYEVLIEVVAAGSNVKDYKHPLPNFFNNALNQGDDCAGNVAAVGRAVRGFQIGDRVAGFHAMDTPYGTYAEYAICPEHTVFRIPPDLTYEEAATIPLAAFTAAVGLYRNLGLPAPWDRSDDHYPEGKTALVINGASTAVGAFAVKLAKMNTRIGPIITTAGSSADFVRSLQPDAVVDYRSPTVTDDIRAALGGTKLRHVFDTSNTLKSIQYLTPVMEAKSRYVCTSKLYANPALGVDDSMETALQAVQTWYEVTFVGDVHSQPFMGDKQYGVKAGGELFGAIMSRVFERALADGTLAGHPYQIVPGGLAGVLDALLELKERKFSGNAKFVTRIADTRKLDNVQ